MNFGLGHGSRRPVPNVNCVTLGQKRQNFRNFLS
jgi:hypothetical protein